MEYDFDIVGIRYESMRVHNQRGNHLIFDFLTQDDYTPGPNVSTTLGYAQANTQIYAVKDDILKVGHLTGDRAHTTDGIAMDSRFQGDMDIGHLSFGDAGDSIGSLYWTDINLISRHTISAH